jgi:hypothetical protein
VRAIFGETQNCIMPQFSGGVMMRDKKKTIDA